MAEKHYEEGRIYRSDNLPGADGNYHWPAKVDMTDGYVGITQHTDHTGKGKDNLQRVLLSPEQWAAAVAFVAASPTPQEEA